MSSGYTSPSSVLALSSALPVLDIMIVVLRFYTRHRQRAALKADDWLLIPALLFTVGMGISIIVGVKGHGLAYPSPPTKAAQQGGTYLGVTPESSLASKIEWINLWLQPLAIGFSKMSIISFYRRIFDVPRRGLFHILLTAFNALLILWIIAYWFAIFFMCGITFSNLWGPYVDLQMRCSGGHAIWIDESFAISDVCLDALIFFLPMPKIWKLQLSFRRHLLVTTIFAVGASAIVGSILRMIILIDIIKGIDTSIASEDGILVVTQLLFWSMLEAGLAIIAACLPTLNSLFSKINAADMIRSLRETISLNSLSSQKSTYPDTLADARPAPIRHLTRERNSLANDGIKAALTSLNPEIGPDCGLYTHAVRDFEAISDVSDGQILVHHSIEHRDD